MTAYLVPGYWCQVRKFGWLPDSPTACTDSDHIANGRHVASERNIAQPEHSVIASWQRGAEAALAESERKLRRTVEGVCNARSLQHAQEIANAALKGADVTDRMQFTDLASYQRIWRWMGECGDTHQQAGEVIFSTPNMHWPGQVARPGDWIVRTPTGFVAEPARPECICPDDPTDLEGPRCPVHEVEQLKADLSAHMDAAKVREAALADARAEIQRRDFDIQGAIALHQSGVQALRERVVLAEAALAESRGRITEIREWAMANEIAEPPLDWARLGEILDA